MTTRRVARWLAVTSSLAMLSGDALARRRVTYDLIARRSLTRQVYYSQIDSTPQPGFDSPVNCTKLVANGTIYFECGGLHYRPYYDGLELVYVIVDPP